MRDAGEGWTSLAFWRLAIIASISPAQTMGYAIRLAVESFFIIFSEWLQREGGGKGKREKSGGRGQLPASKPGCCAALTLQH